MSVRGLIAACHPLPCLAVTGFAAAWSVSIGLPSLRVAGVAIAVLLGQLSVGWCNDWVDAPRDTVAGRRDKPVPQGQVRRRTVGVAAALAAAACVVASLALGVVPGTVHLAAVASAWAYDLGLKSTLGSALPYAVSFGLLPAVSTTAADPAGWPAAGVLVGSALLGVAAHFANTVGDTVADAATGVRGLPQRLGPHRSLQLTAVALAVAAVALLTAAGRPGGGYRPIALVLLVAGTALAGLVAVRGPQMGRSAFRATLVCVALILAGFLLTT